MNNIDLSVVVQKNTTIKMGDGDDTVRISPDGGGDVTFTKNVTIDLGNAAGTDTLRMRADDVGDDSITFGKNLSIKGKAGIQDLDLDGVAVTKNAKVNLGDGNDCVRVSQVAGSNDSTIGGNLDVKLGDGEDDELFVERLAIDGKAKIDGGAGGSDEAEETAGGGLVVLGAVTSNNFEAGNLA
jgi:hypothetical protein